MDFVSLVMKTKDIILILVINVSDVLNLDVLNVTNPTENVPHAKMDFSY